MRVIFETVSEVWQFCCGDAEGKNCGAIFLYKMLLEPSVDREQSVKIARVAEVLLLKYKQGIKGLFAKIVLSSNHVIFIALSICALSLCVPNYLIV